MKKTFFNKNIGAIIAVMMSVSVIFSSGSGYSFASAETLIKPVDVSGFRQPVEGLYGDIDKDGNVSVCDALLALQSAAGTKVLSTSESGRGDVDNTPGVSACDALNILQKSVNAIKSFPCEEYAKREVKELLDLQQTLRFGSDHKFTVLQLSDTQEKGRVAHYTKGIIRAIVNDTNPDFVIFTGDNIYDDSVFRNMYGRAMNTEDFRGYVADLTECLTEKNIPWAVTYGNHDSEFLALNRAEQEAVYESFPLCVGKAGKVDGVGNYVLPILRSDSDKIAFNVWGMDTGTYLNTIGGDIEDAVQKNNLYSNSHYSFIRYSQREWYWNSSVMLEEYNGAKIPGILFGHIPVPEFLLIEMNPDETGKTGTDHEGAYTSAINSGMFATILARGDINGIFVGHDHKSNHMGEYCGIKMGFCGGISYDDYGGYYGYNPDASTCSGRVFEIDENDAANYDTFIQLYTETTDFKTNGPIA